ncbi:MAG: transmembrane 220 family protein, partial [Bacteroidota bacterium]
VYLLTATFLGFAAFKKFVRIPTILAVVAGVIGLGFYVPEVFEWVQAGMPSITGKMKAESQYIEWMREFLGLFLCVAAVFYVWMQQRRFARRV